MMDRKFSFIIKCEKAVIIKKDFSIQGRYLCKLSLKSFILAINFDGPVSNIKLKLNGNPYFMDLQRIF